MTHLSSFMIAEARESAPATTGGWIFFDAECRFCAANRRRWGPLFERRGFVWVPLQTPGAAEKLGVPPDRLMSQMWLLPPGAPVLGGIDAWLVLMRQVWWLKPLAAVLALPGINRLAHAAYLWLAHNRHCVGGQCPARPPPAPSDAPRKPR